MKNIDIINSFITGNKKLKNKSILIDDKHLIHNNNSIAYRYNEKIIFKNNSKYNELIISKEIEIFELTNKVYNITIAFLTEKANNFNFILDLIRAYNTLDKREKETVKILELIEKELMKNCKKYY